MLPESGVRGADHVLIGRQGGIERDFAKLRAELTKALAKLRVIAKLLILIARGWQIGPSRILPPSCRYSPLFRLCNRPRFAAMGR